jgi:hypothetical protein
VSAAIATVIAIDAHHDSAALSFFAAKTEPRHRVRSGVMLTSPSPDPADFLAAKNAKSQKVTCLAKSRLTWAAGSTVLGELKAILTPGRQCRRVTLRDTIVHLYGNISCVA